MIKIGDLVKIKDCPRPIQHPQGEIPCLCAFCAYGSNRIGVVVERITAQEDPHLARWVVNFDFGEWNVSSLDITSGEVEVIS